MNTTQDAEVTETHLPAVQRRGAVAELSVDDMLKQYEKIEDLMKRAMRPGIDYGQIPGTNSKPTLLKPGSEKLARLFCLAPKYVTRKTFHEDGHLTVESTCQVYDSGENFRGEASAMCSTREKKYAWRLAERVCPACGKQAIIKGKAEYGGGWLCWKKKDGCGAQFQDGDPRIESQQTGRVPNPDIGDSYNTVLRIAEKRALIAAMRLVTAASSLFDEEVPDAHERDPEPEPPKSQAQNGQPAAKQQARQEPRPRPKDGIELFERLTAFDKHLSERGYCKPGECLDFVRRRGMELEPPLSDDIATWQAIDFAMAKAQGFYDAKFHGWITEDEEREIRRLLIEREADGDELLNAYQIPELAKLPACHLQAVLQDLHRRPFRKEHADADAD